MISLDQLAIGQKAIIESIETDVLPLKLIEMVAFLAMKFLSSIWLLFVTPFI